jgi:hypothetical protein
MTRAKDPPIIPNPAFEAKMNTIIGFVWGGKHHLKDIKWLHPECVEVWLYGSLSTFDFASMTWLVVLAHDQCVRVEVRRNRGLTVLFHDRSTAPTTQPMILSHPTLEQHVATIRATLQGDTEAYTRMYEELAHGR